VNAAVVVGFVLYGASACVWLLVLARVNLSVAYPFVGLGFIATMLLGAFFLGEPLTVWRVIGTLLIALGVVLVAC
jgi:multidrug transporter EmrE-like cation transporter